MIIKGLSLYYAELVTATKRNFQLFSSFRKPCHLIYKYLHYRKTGVATKYAHGQKKVPSPTGNGTLQKIATIVEIRESQSRVLFHDTLYLKFRKRKILLLLCKELLFVETNLAGGNNCMLLADNQLNSITT